MPRNRGGIGEEGIGHEYRFDNRLFQNNFLNMINICCWGKKLSGVHVFVVYVIVFFCVGTHVCRFMCASSGNPEVDAGYLQGSPSTLFTKARAQCVLYVCTL